METELLKKTFAAIVAVPSISGTSDEHLGADKIYELLSEIPYFQENPQNLRKIYIEHDSYKRYFISAFFCGKKRSNKTVIISGHYDVVGIDDFGHLKEIAFNIEEYNRKVNELSLDEDAKRDLNSGEWIFGRGTADMKFGLALGIELLRELSKRDNFQGNILFMAVPGEETDSVGMLGATKHLLELQDQGYEFVGLLMPEPYIGSSENYSIRYIHTGSCGKLNAVFFFAGKQSHAFAPFSGLNSIAMALEVNRLMELNTELCDKLPNKVSPPPFCLKIKDLNDLYSVTVPLYTASCYNIITFKREPDELLARLKEIGVKAFENVRDEIRRKAASFEKIANVKIEDLDIKPVVFTYSEFYKEVKKSIGKRLDRFLKDKIAKWRSLKYDNQKIAVNIIKETYEIYPNKIPMIIIGFAPPYYPNRSVDPGSEHGRKLLEAVDNLIGYAKEKYGEKFEKDVCFTGISDLSYTGMEDNAGSEEMFKNLLGLNYSYMFPVEQLKKLDIQGVILGCYGKDLHKYTERLNIPFNFNVLPDLYEHIIYKLLQ